jgi:hypothetical protein
MAEGLGLTLYEVSQRNKLLYEEANQKTNKLKLELSNKEKLRADAVAYYEREFIRTGGIMLYGTFLDLTRLTMLKRRKQFENAANSYINDLEHELKNATIEEETFYQIYVDSVQAYQNYINSV